MACTQCAAALLLCRHARNAPAQKAPGWTASTWPPCAALTLLACIVCTMAQLTTTALRRFAIGDQRRPLGSRARPTS
eukprot:366499-Chlamydomonas_euryale.AAC.8